MMTNFRMRIAANKNTEEAGLREASSVSGDRDSRLVAVISGGLIDDEVRTFT